MSDEVLIKCEEVSKRFCRNLKRSLVYGVRDIAREFIPSRGGISGSGSPPQKLRKGEFWAVDGVSFELKRGQCLGLIGHNGAGKTTLLKMLNGLIKPDRGRIEMRGRIGAIIALGAGFNPILSGRENIYANGLIMGLSRKEIDSKLDAIIDFAEIDHAIEAPVRTFSSGMQARLGFAVAAHMNPDILLIDEVLAVGDAAFRNKCLQFVEGIRQNGGAYILVTHSFNQVLTSCPEALLMDQGKAIVHGPSAEVIDRALELQFKNEESNTGGPPPSVRETVVDESPARIIDVSFTGVGGGPIEMGRAAEVILKVEADRPIANASWSFYISSQDGSQRLVSKQSQDAGVTFDLEGGVNILRAETGPISLAAKRYSLRVCLSGENRALDMVGYEGDPLWIKVNIPNSTPEMVRTSILKDLVWVDVLWCDPVKQEAQALES